MKRKLSIEIIAWLIAALLLYASLSKLWTFPVFKLQLKQSPWSVLSSLSGVIAWALPLGEILLALLLLWPGFRRIAFSLSALLFALFTCYLVILLNVNVHLPCSCGGIISRMGWTGHVYLNISFLLLALIGFYLSRKHTRTSTITGS